MIALLLACNGGDDRELLTAEQLQDPAVCQECHPDHYREWSGSMHAYAATDPVFLAMNAQGQRETGGALGDFCVRCHAPAAVALGYATDGDLSDVPEHLKGVTCAFCHSVEEVAGEHNNPLVLADDLVLRGPIRDPVENDAHRSAYSPLLDREDPSSSAMCGSCHDIVTPAGGHIERTFSEWKGSLFAKPGFGVNCSGCHMPGREGVAAEADGVKLRRVHDHSMPGVDTALVPFPEAETQRALVQEALDDSVVAYLCVSPTVSGLTRVEVTLDNVAAGHFLPSGAAADRRMWAEVVAYEGGEIVWSSGRVEDGRPIGTVTDAEDPDLWRMWSTLLDASGEPTHKFWEAADLDVGGVLPVQTTLDPSDPAWVNPHATRTYLVRDANPDRITLAVHVEAIGKEILDELVASGDLDPAIATAVPRFTLAPTVLEWTPAVPPNAGDVACVPDPVPGI